MHDVPAPPVNSGSAGRRACTPRVRDPRAAAHAFHVSEIPRGSARASRVSQLNAAQLSPPLGTLAPRPHLSRPSWRNPPTPGEMVARGVLPHPPTSSPSVTSPSGSLVYWSPVATGQFRNPLGNYAVLRQYDTEQRRMGLFITSALARHPLRHSSGFRRVEHRCSSTGCGTPTASQDDASVKQVRGCLLDCPAGHTAHYIQRTGSAPTSAPPNGSRRPVTVYTGHRHRTSTI